MPPTCAGGMEVSVRDLAKRLEAELADQFDGTPALGRTRDCSPVRKVPTGIGERWRVGEVRCVQREVEGHTLPDRERLAKRSVHHMQTRSVNAVAAHVA